MAKPATRPYLVAKDESGKFRITVRETRLNSQGFALVKSTMLDDVFATATAARSYIREHYRGEAADIATK